MLNFFCRKKGGLKFTFFYTFFTNNLSQKGYCAPSVSEDAQPNEYTTTYSPRTMEANRDGGKSGGVRGATTTSATWWVQAQGPSEGPAGSGESSMI